GPAAAATPEFVPDLAAIAAAPTRVVLAAGAASEGQLCARAAAAVAERLGTSPVVFPGDHAGFLGGEYGQTGEPDAFAATPPAGPVRLADGLGRRPQPVDRPQEPAVLRVAPAHVARPPPAVGPEPVEAAVVADPAVRVPLDVVVAESGELRPGVEEPRPAPG